MKKLLLPIILFSLVLMAAPYYERTFKADDPLKDVSKSQSVSLRIVDGNAVEVSTVKPDRYCHARFSMNLDYKPQMLLEVEYRNIVPEGRKLNYTGLGVVLKDGLSCFHSLPESHEWTKQRVKMNALRITATRSNVPVDSKITAINLYNRSSDSEEPFNSAIQVRLIRIIDNPKYNSMDNARLSYSAIPFLSWGKRGEQVTPGDYEVTFKKADSNDVVLQDNSPVNYYTTSEPLKPGFYEAIVRVKGNASLCFMERIIVPERRHTWKMPEYDWDKVAATPHPRLLPLANFYNPETAPSYRLKGYMPPKDPQVWKEGADPQIRAWIEWYGKIGGLISSTGRRLTDLGQNAMMTGDKEMIETAKSALLFVARTWDPEGASNISRCDLQCGNLLLGMCWCYDAVQHVLTPEEKADAEKALLARGAQFMSSSCPFTSNEAQNHPWDRAQKAAFVALTLAERPEMRYWFDYICKLYAYRFIPSLGFDGENNEGLGYWSYGVGLLVRLVDAARQVAGVNFYTHPWLKNTARFPMYCAPNMGYAMPFGDCAKPNHNLMGPINRIFTAKLATEADDPQALWYSGYTGTETLAPKSPASLPQSVFYPHLGMAFFNTFLPDARENVAVAFRSGKFFAGHQHNDLNTFSINAYGDKLAIDGGYYDWCGSKHHQAYTIQTIAHNTILFNGNGQKGCKPGLDGYILGYLDCDDFGYVAGDAATSGVYGEGLQRFDRQMVFVKPDYVFVYDTLEAKEPSTFSWLIHSQAEKPMEFHLDGSFTIRRPKARLNGALYADTPFTFSAGESYTEMPVNGYSVDLVPNRELEWTLTGKNRTPVKAMHYLAAMSIQKAEWPDVSDAWEKQELPQGGTAIRNGNCIAIFAGGAKEAEAYGLKTDGTAAGVRLEDGKVRSGFAVNATHLEYKGKVLASSLQKGNLTVCKPVMQELKIPVTLDGKPLDSDSYLFNNAGGHSVWHLSCLLEFETGKRLRVKVRQPKPGFWGGLFGKKPEGGFLNLRQSNEKQNKGQTVKPGEKFNLSLLAGKTLVSISADALVGEAVEMVSTDSRMVPCEMKEIGWQPPQDAILNEAEVIDSQETLEGKSAKATERPSASGGKASVGWDYDGQAGTWKIAIPEEGDYQLFICTASTNYKLIVRELFMDGGKFSKDFDGVSWGTTGGFGYSPDEWRWVAVPGSIHLKAGIHTLGMAVYTGSSNLDVFAFVKK